LSASSSMSSGRWTINGDIDPSQLAETILVEPASNRSNRLQVVVNDTVLDVRAARRVKSIIVNAGDGNDTVTVQLPDSLSRIVVTINGGAGDDTLNAGSNRGILHGGDGDDTLNGSASGDELYGELGDDVLNGNGGDDILQGGEGEDTLIGGMGADDLRGGAGKDWIYSEPGTDLVEADSEDVVTHEQGVGLQQFDTEEAFYEWLSHTDLVNQQLGYGSIFAATGGPLLDAVRANSGAAAAPSHSETNNQVDGVDEQDVVETDGDYVYTVRGEELLIIDVRQPADPVILSRTQLGGWGSEMYLDGDRLTVISSYNRWYAYPDPVGPVPTIVSSRFAYPGWNWRPQSQVTTYDLSDRSEPKVVEQTVLDGSASTSRSVDGRIYLVVDNSLWARYPYLFDYALTDSNTVSISGASLDPKLMPPISDWSSFTPQYTTTSYDASGTPVVRTGSLLDAPNIWATEDVQNNSNLLTIAMFDVHHGDAGIDSTSSVYGLSGQVYASGDALYVAAQNWTYAIATSDSTSTTSVYKFDLSEEGSKLVATGKVDGTIIDQFSMDEHDGYFRIATTSNNWQANSSSNVFILQQQGGDLVTVSSLTGLSPTERIQGARFVGDHVYLSTFLRVDPLLDVNLSDPQKPVVTGELEVPGFSSYLQQWGDHYLVSIGQDADPQTGMVTGLQLSLFDVSGDQPVLVDAYKLGVSSWDAYSQAQWDHHAFSLFDEQGILAIPVSKWTSNSDHVTQLQVFQLDAIKGFGLLGTVDHESEVVRSLRIGDELVSLSDSTLKINDLVNPSTEVGEVELGNPDSPIPEPFPGPIFIDPPVVANGLPVKTVLISPLPDDWSPVA
jgi:inhibitor of cysteine peptidase